MSQVLGNIVIKSLLGFLRVQYQVHYFSKFLFNNLFLFANKFETSNYADDIYAAIKNISQILNDLSNDSGSVYGFLEQNFELHYENTVIKKSGEEKMLGITIDNKLKLKSHIKNI